MGKLIEGEFTIVGESDSKEIGEEQKIDFTIEGVTKFIQQDQQNALAFCLSNN